MFFKQNNSHIKTKLRTNNIDFKNTGGFFMNKFQKIKKSLALALTGVIALSLLAACKTEHQRNPGPSSKTVLATNFVVYDWAKNIIGDCKGISLQYAFDTNVDTRSYQPTEAELAKLKEADMILCVGGESEKWLLDAGIERGRLVPMIEHCTLNMDTIAENTNDNKKREPIFDEDVWSSSKNTKMYCDVLLNKFSEIDPANKTLYAANHKNYVSQLDGLGR